MFCCLAILITAMLFAGLESRCAGVPGLSIQRLVAQSDLIVVARIIKVPGLLTVRSTYTARFSLLTLWKPMPKAEQNLKGVRQDSTLAVRFAVPMSPSGSVGYGRLVSQQDRLLFLRNIPDGGGYEPTDPYYPSLPAARTRDVSSNSEPDVNRPKLKEVGKSCFYRMSDDIFRVREPWRAIRSNLESKRRGRSLPCHCTL